MGWVGVDFDGTLATHESFEGPDAIGDPIPVMVSRVNDWLDQGKEVRIFTARVHPGIFEGGKFRSLDLDASEEELEDAQTAAKAIDKFCKEYFKESLTITCLKDHSMEELWDDKAIGVEKNTGEIVTKRLIKKEKIAPRKE